MPSLFDRKELGVVTGTDGRTYIVCSGRYCEECDAETAVYVYDLTIGLPDAEENANARMHPGTARDGETREPYYGSRAFFGEVLQGVPGVIWFERSLGATGDMEERTALLDLSMGMKDSQLQGHALLERTLALATQGKCLEIEGIDRTSAP
ncbi:MAG: hypothetical protein IPL52_16540 [Flavobacteriales bacterium]|nr:hypothetical protein [Flavobacteriales bacterium]